MPTKKLRTRLRFTPGPPTRAALAKYPLWCMALDEEERPGQDESTIRPSDDQERIDDSTAYVAAVAKTPSGRTFDAMIEGDGYGINATNDVEQITIWIDDEPVLVKLLGKKLWVHRSNRSPLGYFNDQHLPLEVRAVVPGAKSKPFTITLLADGRIRYAAAPRKIPRLPPIIRPSDIPDGQRTMVEETTAGVVIDRAISEDAIEAYASYDLRSSGPRLLAHEEYHNLVKASRSTVDVEYDARTLAVLSIARTTDGKPLPLLESGKGRAIPENCFFSIDLPLLVLPLVEGWSARFPVFRTDWERVDYALVTVEGIGAAPRQPHSRAWRVRIDGRGSFYQLKWYDMATRQCIATEFLSEIGSTNKLIVDNRVLQGVAMGR
jgi:hypothetical protein